MNAITLIGNTTLFRLERMVPADSASVFLKLEYENPTGSMKDRMALAMVDAAERDGRLKPGGSVVEYTGGSTGTSLALVCAAKGYRLRIVSSDAFSREKRDHMAALGAELVLVRSEGGLTTKKLILDMIETARALIRDVILGAPLGSGHHYLCADARDAFGIGRFGIGPAKRRKGANLGVVRPGRRRGNSRVGGKTSAQTVQPMRGDHRVGIE